MEDIDNNSDFIQEEQQASSSNKPLGGSSGGLAIDSEVSPD